MTPSTLAFGLLTLFRSFLGRTNPFHLVCEFHIFSVFIVIIALTFDFWILPTLDNTLDFGFRLLAFHHTHLPPYLLAFACVFVCVPDTIVLTLGLLDHPNLVIPR